MPAKKEAPVSPVRNRAASSRDIIVRLAGGVAIANAFLYVLVGSSLLQSREQYERQAELTSQNLAQSLEANVSMALDKIAMAVDSVAGEAERQLAAGGFRDTALEAYSEKQWARVPETEAISVSDSAGNVRYGVAPPRAPATSVADRDFFRAARASAPGESILLRPVISERTGRWVLVLAHAIRTPDGRFAGVAWAALPLDHFMRLLSSLDVGSKGLLTIRWADMGLVARLPQLPGASHSIGERSATVDTLENLRIHPQSGNYRAVALADGIDRRLAYRLAPRWPLYIFVGEAVDDYLAPWYQEASTLVSLAALFTLVSVLWARSSLRTRQAELRAFNELQSGKELLERSETRFRTLYNATSDAVMLLRREGFVDCNPAALELFGVDTKDELAAGPGPAFSAPFQSCGTESRTLAERRLAEAYEAGGIRFEWMFRRPSTGEVFPTEVQYTRVMLDGVAFIQAVIRDITDRKKAEEQIRYLAYFDALTKLPNRRLLMDRLARALLASRRTQQYGMLLILDLDNFKGLNDTRGHDVGDHLLIEVAQRITACVRQEDTVARLGGDEYVVMAESLGTDPALAAGQAEQIAGKICRMVALPSPVPGTSEPHHSTASIGVTLFQGETTSIDVLLKQADLALYQAKAAGRNTVRFFNPQMQAAIDSRSAMESALHNGLRNSEFRLHYQPQFDAEGRLTGAEALLRWYRESSAPVAPGDFIPLAEETGLIIPIGLWVMQTACEQLKSWAAHHATRALTIAVNVSPRQFRQADFADQVRSCIARTGADPTLLELEITESIVLDDIEDVIARMHRLRTIGIRFALDDFGTGFSSLSYLKRLPLDQVKIDQGFVRDVVSDPNDGAIVRAIVAMGRSLALDVIAEGVETHEQLAFLKESGCNRYQGYLFGRPMPIEDWDALVDEPTELTG